MKIGQRLGLGFGAILALMVGVTVFGINEVRLIDKALTEITDVNAVKQRYAINFRGSVHDRAISLRDIVLHESQDATRGAVAEIRALEGFYSRSAELLDRMFSEQRDTGSDERQALARIKAVENRTLPLIERVIELRQSGREVEAKTLLLQQAAPAFVEWLASINTFIDLQEERNQAATAGARTTAGNFAMLMLMLCAVAILLGVTVAWLITRNLIQSLGGEPGDAVAMVRSIASGDLSSGITTNHPQSMLAAMGSMQRELSAIFREVNGLSDDITTRSEELGNASREASHSAQRQSESSRTSANKVDDIVTQMREVTELAQHTEVNSRKTLELSKSGIAMVDSAGAEMNKIAATVQTSSDRINKLRQGSEKISGSAQVIREIADQTNLLALNAAIEAARAGESGRGFAVVADEVRKLAERTSMATSEIAQVIGAIESDTQHAVDAMNTAIPQVRKGLELSRNASEMLADITRQAEDSLNQAGEVVRTTNGQTTRAESLNATFHDFAIMSQQMEQAVGANVQTAEDLERIAHTLREHMARFKLSK